MKNKMDKELLIQKVQSAFSILYKKEMLREHAEQIVNLTEQMIEISSGDFVCSKCKEKFKLYVFTGNKEI